MKKNITVIMVTIMMVVGFFCINKSYAVANNIEQVMPKETESTIVQLKEKEMKSLEDYKERYGSDSYGLTAYILNLIRIYSIPLCFLGIAISAMYQYVIGIRKLDTQEKGLVLMVSFITILVICQILPLAFAIVVKFGRG